MSMMHLKSPGSGLFAQPFIQAQIKQNIKAPHRCPLRGEFTGDRWIPLHKVPVIQKMFPFDDTNMLTCFLRGHVIAAAFASEAHLPWQRGENTYWCMK